MGLLYCVFFVLSMPFGKGFLQAGKIFQAKLLGAGFFAYARSGQCFHHFGLGQAKPCRNAVGGRFAALAEGRAHQGKITGFDLHGLHGPLP